MGYKLGRKSGKTRTLSVADVADALERGDLAQQEVSFFGSPELNEPSITNLPEGLYITSACALGQAAVGLKVDVQELMGELDTLLIKDEGVTVSDLLIELNDERGFSFSEIANRLREAARRAGFLDYEVTVKRRTYTPAG